MSAPAFAPGVRFRRKADGQGMLLIPEGVVDLNASAAAIAELIDGRRSREAIAQDLCGRFDASPAQMQRDVDELLRRFAAHAWLAVPTVPRA